MRAGRILRSVQLGISNRFLLSRIRLGLAVGILCRLVRRVDAVRRDLLSIRHEGSRLVGLSLCELFGGLYLGAALPKSAQGQYRAGEAWQVTNGGRDAGTWGGHAMWEARTVLHRRKKLVTWGGLQEATDAWDRAYVDEKMALVPADWQKHMPAYIVEAGIVDFQALNEALQEITR